MISFLSRIMLLILLGTHVAMAQTANDAADHEALRKLKADVLSAINTRNLANMDKLLHKPFQATTITLDTFDDSNKLKAWFDNLFKRPLLGITSMHIDAEADELAGIFNGTFAVARGSTNEHYELPDGRSFDLKGRWTATAIKENGQWKVLSIQDGINFLDNPVINAIERNGMYFAAGGAGIGAVIALPLGFLFGRRRARKA